MSLIDFPDQYVNVNGLSIRYCEAGQGQPLLLLHGLGASLEYWYKNIPILAKNYRVIAVDLPGCGKSDTQVPSTEIDYYIDFVKNFIAALNISQLYLVGHSLGGALALRFASDHTDEVQKLALLDNVGFARQVDWKFRLLTIPLLRNLFMHFNRQQFAAALRSHVYNSQSITDEFVDALYPHASKPENKAILLRIMQSNATIFGIKNSSLKDILKNVVHLKKIPVRVFWGRQDSVLYYHPHMDNAKKCLPHAEFITLEECSHIPQIEQTEQINQGFIEFFQ